MRGPSYRRLRSVCLLAPLCLWVACEDQPVNTVQGTGGTAQIPAEAAAGAATKEAAPLVLKDDDFAESLRNRDPFRVYTTVFRAEAPTEMQRQVVMPSTPIEEMRLIAIITGLARPKAMMVDASGVGYVVERGDYLGRPKVIQAAGSVALALNWRVDRIRDNEVVLTQQDPSDPTRTGVTKIIALSDDSSPN